MPRASQIARGAVAATRTSILVGVLVAIFAAILVPSAAFATALPEKITENMTLTAAGNPYTGSPTIEAGATVTAEPGVEFNLSKMIVKGTLKAEGTVEAPVLFTSVKEEKAGEWSNIKFEPGSGESVIDHTEVKYGGKGGGSPETKVISINASSPEITNSTFLKNETGAIEVPHGGSPVIAHNQFINNGHYYLGRETIRYDATALEPGQVDIHDNVVEDGGGSGITVSNAYSTGLNVYDNVVEDGDGNAISISNPSATGSGGNVSGNEAINNEGVGLSYSGGAIPTNISNNTLIGNNENRLKVEGTVAQSTSWDGVFSFTEVTVAAGVTLTLVPGAVLNPGTLIVKGTLKAEGTAEDPVVFTSGAKSPLPGDWRSIKFEPGSSESVVDHAEVKYGGKGDGTPPDYKAIEINKSSPKITNSTFYKNDTGAVAVTHGGSPEIAHNQFIRNGTYAISRDTVRYDATVSEPGEVNIHDNLVQEAGGWGITVSDASSGGVKVYDNVVENSEGYGITVSNSSGVGAGGDLSGNILVGNEGIGLSYSGPAIPVSITDNTLIGNTDNRLTVSGTVAQSSTWNTIGGAIKFSDVTVAAGVTLTIAPGVVLNPGKLTVKGTLKAEGTLEKPIAFTSAAKAPKAGEWNYIKFESGSGESVLKYTEIAYGGSNSETGAVQINASSPTITHSTFLKNEVGAIKVPSGGSPEIAHNTFIDNGYYYLGRETITYNATPALPGAVNIHDNLVLNGGGGGISVSNTSSVGAGGTLGNNTLISNEGTGLSYSGAKIPGNITENTLIENERNYISISGTVAHSSTWKDGGTRVHVSGEVVVDTGVTLKITEGVYLTRPNFKVKGTLKAEGTSAKPVVFTGENQVSAGEWGKILFEAGSGESVLDHVEVAYGGSGSSAGMIEIKGSNPRVTNSTIRKSKNFGIKVTESGAPKIEWNRFRNNTNGISYSGTGNLSTPSNDWNCSNGPKPAGCGDSVTSNVKWKPAVQLPELAGHCRGTKSQCGEGADPVILATGQLSYSRRDLLLTNKGDVPLEFTRAYSSGSSADTGLGPGWSQTGLASATELASGDVLVLRPDGRQDLFEKVEGGYESPSGVTDALAKVEGTFQLTTLEGAIYRFDESGRIASITDDHGLKTTYGYDANGRLATITDPSSQTLTFSYNSSNHITSVKDSTSREVKFTYSVAGDLATATDALGGVTEYTYDADHRLKTIKDPRGNVILKNTYDGQGRIVEQLDGLENLWKLEYKEDETIVTEPEGGKITYGFDGQDRVVSEKDQLGHTTATSYDAAGNVDEIIKPGGAKWEFGYDGSGNLTSVVDPEEGERSYEYDGKNRLTSFTDEREETWTYEWSEANDLKKVTDPAEGETTATYNASGQPLTITDPNENTTTFTYDTRGNRLTAKDALEHTTTFAYSTRNHLTSKTVPGLEPETYSRSALGDLLSVTTPEGNKTEYTYDANGMPKQIKDPAENVWKIELNAMERPTAYIDPLGNETKIEYDGNFNAVKVTDRRGKETTYDYDLANQLVGMEHPEGGDWEFEHDARGNRIESVDPRENVTTYGYDLLDRMVEVAEPLEAVTSYIYDPAGNLTFVTDPRENTTGLGYDELGRLTDVYQPLEKTTSFTYDAAGNWLTRTTAAGTIELEYDAANRLREIAEGESVLRSFDYDPANRLIAAVDAQSDEIEIDYDDDGRVISMDDGRGQTIAREYDTRGNVVKQTDGRGTLEYEYDKLGHMISLTDPQEKALDFDFDAEGNLTDVELPNGVVTTNEFDNAGRLAETTSAKGETVLESLEYEYDPSGNRIVQVDRLSQETTYSYDALNRLVKFDPPGEGSTSYDYDAAGNRTEAGATTYGFNDLNQLTSASDGTTYDYDDSGRLVEVDEGEVSTLYGWSILDELTSADSGAQEIDYGYDAFGRQVLRDDGSTIRPSHYGDLSDRPIVDTDAEGNPTMTYVQGPDGLVEQRSGEATSFPLPDAHGDVTTLVDGEGAVASRQTYSPWGEQLTGPSLDMGWLGAQQRRSDPATGLVQMGVRSYDPIHGRFLTEDPIAVTIGMGQLGDRYTYAANNPPNLTDLTGRSIFEDIANGGKEMVKSWAEDPLNFGDPREMVTAAQEYWVGSDSPIAPVAGSAVSMVDLAVNPDRLGDYIKAHPWAGKQILADCYESGHPARTIGSLAGGAGGFGAGVASARDLGMRSVGVGAVSGAAGAGIGAGVGALGGCAFGAVSGSMP